MMFVLRGGSCSPFRLAKLVAYFTRRSLVAAATAVYTPLLVAFLAVGVLPHFLAKAYGSVPAYTILTGYVAFLAILASVPLSIMVVIEARTPALLHLVSSPTSLTCIAVARMVSILPFTLAVVGLGVFLATLAYRAIALENLGVALASLTIGSLGIAGLVVAAAYPFRSPQVAGIVSSAIVAIFQYLSPIYYPLNVLPHPLDAVMLIANPLTAAAELMRQHGSVEILLPLQAVSSTVWFGLGTVLLAKRIEKGVEEL